MNITWGTNDVCRRLCHDVFCWWRLAALSDVGDVGVVAGVDGLVVVVEGGRGGGLRMVVVVVDRDD